MSRAGDNNTRIAVVSFIGALVIFVLADTPQQVKDKELAAYQRGYEEGALAATKKEYECTLERMPDWTTGWVCKETSNED